MNWSLNCKLKGPAVRSTSLFKQKKSKSDEM